MLLKDIHKTREQLLAEFEAAPPDALVSQYHAAAMRGCSRYLMERDRWEGKGIPFVRDGRTVRYRKSDVLAWLAGLETVWPGETREADDGTE